MTQDLKQEPIIVNTNSELNDGQNKCPKCGATDISINTKSGALRCNFCRHEFELEKMDEFETDISNLQGDIIGSGAQNIVEDTNEIMTFKCSSCGAEVVIDTSETTQARCHWCRNTLSINQQISNGAVPDVVLPFKLSKKEAQEQINKFVNKRSFFANKRFKEEFTTDNIMGVYFPYMVVDINAHASFIGKGEHEVRKYTRGNNNNRTTYYDADVYEVEREFDLNIDDLTVESSEDKLNKKSSNKTNNIINAIMPFDTENCVKWNANYLKGFTSEKRDTNIEELQPIVETQSKDIARFAANDTLKNYDRGVCWEKEDVDVKGKQWKSAYLPVWLYSYQQVKNEKNKILHYVAVNARTKEIMGSVPIDLTKLVVTSMLVEIIGLIAMILASDFKYSWLFALAGFIFFFIMNIRYRNANARHKHETETKREMKNLRTEDIYIKRLKGLRNSKIDGANNMNISGQNSSEIIFNALNNFK